jgi:chromosome segregation ATPase
MTAEQITTILSSLGVIGFLWMWVRALKKQISEMNKTIEVQQKTLEELKKQISEMNKTIEVQQKTLEELKKQISEMNKTIEVQQKTLEAMKTQVSETEKVGSIYRQFIEELPSEIEKYKTLLSKLRGDQISKLKKANEYKDERLKETAEIEIKKLELQQRALDDIPALIAQFEEIATTIDQRLSTVDQLVNHMPSHRPATWKWLSAFSTIEPNLILIHSDNEDTEVEPKNISAQH